MRFISQNEAQEIDRVLMSPEDGCFSLDQLMELAGLSVAECVQKVYGGTGMKRIMIMCGPGSNGGDGLVAARHLSLFGFSVDIFCPKPSHKDLYQVGRTCGAEAECVSMEIPVLSQLSELREGSWDVMIDALFGTVRPPFHTLLVELKERKEEILSVDIPSGWHVEQAGYSNLTYSTKTLRGMALLNDDIPRRNSFVVAILWEVDLYQDNSPNVSALTYPSIQASISAQKFNQYHQFLELLQGNVVSL